MIDVFSDGFTLDHISTGLEQTRFRAAKDLITRALVTDPGDHGVVQSVLFTAGTGPDSQWAVPAVNTPVFGASVARALLERFPYAPFAVVYYDFYYALTQSILTKMTLAVDDSPRRVNLDTLAGRFMAIPHNHTVTITLTKVRAATVLQHPCSHISIPPDMDDTHKYQPAGSTCNNQKEINK